jgi:hypothetical protein
MKDILPGVADREGRAVISMEIKHAYRTPPNRLCHPIGDRPSRVDSKFAEGMVHARHTAQESLDASHYPSAFADQAYAVHSSRIILV